MDFFDSFILGALQGITEFLPISSSGHLVLVEHFLGLNAAVLKGFDVALHFATFLAILVYFWKDVWGMLKVLGNFFIGKFDRKNEYLKLILFILIGTVPAVIFGLFADKWIDETFRNVFLIGILMIIMAIVYLFGEIVNKYFYAERSLNCLNWRKALIIGCAQAVALIPGISRSGATIISGLFQGIKRETVARFSFLLGLPAIAGAMILTFYKSGESLLSEVEILPLLIGFLSAFVFGLLSVFFLMMFLKRHSLIIFSIYLIAVGISVEVLLLSL